MTIGAVARRMFICSRKEAPVMKRGEALESPSYNKST